MSRWPVIAGPLPVCPPRSAALSQAESAHHAGDRLKFLKTIDREVSQDLDIYLILPRPSLWTATAESILAKVARRRIALERVT